MAKRLWIQFAKNIGVPPSISVDGLAAPFQKMLFERRGRRDSALYYLFLFLIVVGGALGGALRSESYEVRMALAIISLLLCIPLFFFSRKLSEARARIGHVLRGVRSEEEIFESLSSLKLLG